MSKPVPQSKTPAGILAQRCVSDAQRYFDRHGYAPPPDLPAPHPDLDIVVVVPALAEPDVVSTLESVAATVPPACPVELLLVVNAARDATGKTRQANRQTLATASDWAARHHESGLKCHVIDHCNLPPEHASVGLARKLGLDAGLARLAATRSGHGILVSLDADCRVAPNYLAAIDHYFRRTAGVVGATIHFEHPLDSSDACLTQAIIEYELHLRCYRHGLAAAGSAYARYTIGSAFAVRSQIYAQEGGMNRRMAGEDFYFVNKMLKRGPVGEITDTTVFPAARISDRVPFGTGAALLRSQHETITTYAPAVYLELKTFLRSLETSVLADRRHPPEYDGFLDTMGFAKWLRNTRANVASPGAMSDQLRRWLDGFRTMKFVNWLTMHRHRRVAVCEAAREILDWRGIDAAGEPVALLEQFRSLDRSVD